ncbi:MAG: hypothetical protein ACE5GE_07050, partial [Phycisphaerae bacterium]
PQPAAPVSVQIDPAFVNRFMGQAVTPEQIRELLTPLGFTVDQTGDKLTVAVPGFRATKDVAIEADVIEEIARCVGYNNIEPALPDVAVRSVPPSAAHELEQNSLRLWCLGLGYTEIHGYIWDDADWCRRLGFDPGPCIELRNPVADGQHRLRPSLMPGLLAALEKNRHHLAEFKLIELGSVFEPDHNQHRRLAVLSAKRQKGAEDALLAELRGAVESWAWQILDTPARFGRIESNTFKPWQHQQKTAQVTIGDTPCGTVSVAPLALRRAIDDHLAPWSVAWAEIDLDSLIDPPPVRALHDIPEYPQKDLDFTAVVQAENTYQEVSARIARFEHPLLLRITFVASYEGKSLGAGKRSLTVRAKIGAADRTLVEDDLIAFGQAFERHLASIGLQLRGAG